MTVEPLGDKVTVWGEGPIWHQEKLWYVDIEAHDIVCYDPQTRQHQTHAVGQRIGTIVPRQGGGLAWAGDQGFFVMDHWQGPSRQIIDPEAHLPDNRFNDGKCDPAGRFWAGSICLAKRPEAALYCLHPDGRCERKFAPVTNSNGIVWSRDAGTMYYIDTPTKKVRAFDFDAASGQLSGERVIWDTASLEGSPDGMAIDDADRLWVAFCHGGCVLAYDPASGKVLERIEVPSIETTACAFGGADFGDLYITSGLKPGLSEPLGGRLFVCRPGAKGLAANAFAG